MWTFLTDLIRECPSRIGETEFGLRLRRWPYRRLLRSLGEDVKVFESVRIYSPGGMSIGSRVTLSAGCMFNAEGTLVIGDDVLIGHGTYVWTLNHDYDVPCMTEDVRYTRRPVVIEDNVWICAGVRIVPGVTVHAGAVVAMGSVVTSDVPANTLVAGVPARVVKPIRPCLGAGPTDAGRRGSE